MSRKKANIIGLELGKSVAKFVEYSPVEKQVKTIAILFIEPTEWNDITSLAEKIKDWVKKYKMTPKKTEVVAAVYGEHSIIKNIEISPGESDPDDTLIWELEQTILSPLNEYSFDYQKMESPTTSPKYLLAAYRKSEVQKLIRLIDSPDLKLSVVDIDLFAVQNAFELNYPELVQAKNYLVKADLQNINIIQTENSQFQHFETLFVNPRIVSGDEDERLELLKDLVEKIKTCLQTDFQYSGQEANLMICGDLAVDFDFMQFFKESIPGEIQKLNPFKEVKFPHKIEYAEKVSGSAPQCAAALGLALRYAGDSL